MKKKIFALTLCIAMLAIAIVGGTLAYFTDTDAQVNTFTSGNVAIDLWEDFGNNSGIEKLIPATGSIQEGTLKNGIEKEIYVMNTGSEDAYVRVHIAIPAILDNGDPDSDESAKVLHFTFDSENAAEGRWDWSKTTGAEYTGDWNFYTTTIDGIEYNVRVVTYESKLAKNEETVDAIDQVYMDSKVTNENIAEYKVALGEEWHIYVVAEGAQAAGFENAYEALNTAFGDPADPGYISTIDWDAIAEGYTFVNNDAE